LLLRLGLFGVRFCLRRFQEHPDVNATQLAQLLVEASGIQKLINVLEGHFGARSAVLRARSALSGLRALAGELEASDEPDSRDLRAAVERVEAGAHELAELRLLHMLLTRAVELSDDQHAEATRMTAGGDPAERLGLPSDTGREAERTEALRQLEDWRLRAAHPLTDRTTADACEIIAQSYERLLAELAAGSD
jgi:hypothetical protein